MPHMVPTSPCQVPFLLAAMAKESNSPKGSVKGKKNPAGNISKILTEKELNYYLSLAPEKVGTNAFVHTNETHLLKLAY